MSALFPLRSTLRLPRYTVRLRLTLLFGGLFLASGVGLLVITYILVSHSTQNYLFLRNGNRSEVFLAQQHNAPKMPNLAALYPGKGATRPSIAIIAPQAIAQIRLLMDQAARQHADELHQLLVQSGIALAIMSVVAIVLGWLVAGRVLRPLRIMTTAVREISASNLHARLALDGPNDELTELGNTFDRLLDRLETAFEAQRRFVANASHELRTPLTRQRTLIELALDDPAATRDSLQTNNARVLAAVEQQERLIEALLTLARSERGIERHQAVDLATVAHDVLATRRQEAWRRRVHLDATLAAAPTTGDPPLIERLVANLVDNAIHHNTVDGWVAVATESREGQAVLLITNGGPPIPPEAVERLFQPFQRLSADRTGQRAGQGLGLSIVKAIAVAHGASVTAHAPPQGGLAMEVRFAPPCCGAVSSGSLSHEISLATDSRPSSLVGHLS